MKKFFCALGIAVLMVASVAWADEIESLHKMILYPTVRVRATDGAGSGVLFSCIPNKDGKIYQTYVLTNYHIIESAIKIEEEWNPLTKKMEKKETRATVEVEIFKYQHLSQATGTLLIQADIKEWNKQHDLALLMLRSDDKLDVVKRYPQGKENELKIFMDIYVCGSGLGRSPFPTKGQISSLRDEIDNLPYWMINAPTVFGNSGGGVFLAHTKEYIGIPSRLAVTWTGWSQNAVYHMAYMIPIPRIYSWLEKTGWASLFDPTVKSHAEWLQEKKKERKSEETVN